MRHVFVVTILAAVAVALPATAEADVSQYGIESTSAAASTPQAGAHPDFTLSVALKKDSGGHLLAKTRDFFFDIPPGLLGNPTAVPTCTVEQLVSTDVEDPSNTGGCPQASQVGITEVEIEGLVPVFEPIYDMVPRFGEPARFGFFADSYPILIDTRIRPEDGYGVTAMVEGASAFATVISATSTLWGVPTDKSHDSLRITPWESLHNGGVPVTGERPANITPASFMINPTGCGTPQGVGIKAIPYADPALEAEAFAPMAPNSGCELLDFKPQMAIAPTSEAAETGSGLNVELSLPTSGLEDPNLKVGSAMKSAEVTLPAGITVNPSQAVGLGVCSKADYENETAASGPNAGCPETSKIGSATAHSPLIDKEITGSLYVAKPYENPFGTLIALYMVFKAPSRGVIVKLPLKVAPDSKTGQLVTTVENIPQVTVGSSFELHFRDGARSPLVTPPTCGTYQSTATLTPWAKPASPEVLHPSFQISHGVDGGPCPSGAPPFRPGLTAGSIDNNAGSYSPDYLRLTRQDGDQDLTRFSATLPPGAVAKLAGVERCSDAAIEVAKVKTGKEEQAFPSCPSGSVIGHVLGGAGVGQVLTYAEGDLYLAGPYNGSQLSVVAIVPAVAGPFDVGTIVTRQALSLDPDTGRGVVDGSRSDPLPHILAGILLKVRDIRAYVDRPDFTLNPTNCDPLAFDAELWGGGIDPFGTADDSPVSLSARFQAANCALLGYKPRLKLTLKGGTHRGAHPALRAVFRPRKGDANGRAVQVTLPRSAFIEQSHFRTICTRVQFAADQCPAGSIYGHVRAFTPLLDEPLEGPVYLRSSSHKLPDLVFALRGIVEINVVAKVDSVDGRLRGTFASIPDAPLTKAVLTMQGARKGLFVNSTDLCRAEQRAEVRLTAQNAKRHNIDPVVASACGKVRHQRHRSKH